MARGAGINNEALVLAAGSGRRFGGSKLTSPWRGGLLIDAALAAAFTAPVRAVTVVTGADPKVAPAAEAFAARTGQSARLRLVHAADHLEGMGASLRAGAAALPDDAAAAIVFLGDMPGVPHDLAGRLLAAVAEGAEAAAPVLDGRRGHPVAFSKSLFGQLKTLAGDEGARRILGGLGDRLALIPVEGEGIFRDIDTPEDLTS